MISHRHSRSSKPSQTNNGNVNTTTASTSSSLVLPSTTSTTSPIITHRSTNNNKTSNYWMLPVIFLLTFIITNVRSSWNDDDGIHYYYSSSLHGKKSMALEEELSESESEPYHNSAAICAIQKGALRYIDEWVYYNLLAIGFEHIYFFDNSDDFELQAWHANLQDNKIASSLQQRISIQHFPGINRQNEAYTMCAKRIQSTKAHQWIAFIDVDEFLVFRSKHYSNIMELLNTLPKDRYAGLAINWVVVSMNQQRHYQPLPVTMRFTKRAANATDTHIKTIARTEQIKFVGHPHFVNYYKPSPLMRIWEWRTGPMIATRDTDGHRVFQAWNKHKTVDDVALYHYHTKSLEEYQERCLRGRADVPEEDQYEQLPCQSEEVIKAVFWNWTETITDDLPWQLLKERVPAYANQFEAS